MLAGRERALAEVDLEAVRANVRRLMRDLPDGAVHCAVVKANGYGHGAVPVAGAALEAGSTWLGVATPGEAEELRAAGFAAPILIFGPMTGVELGRAVAAGAEVVVWSASFLDAALSSAPACTSSSTRGWAALASPRRRRARCARGRRRAGSSAAS